MSLSTTSLSTRIENNISTAFGEAVNPYMHKFAVAIATAIIDEIKANGVVSISYQDLQYNQLSATTSDVTRTTTGTIS
jgi:hypothetical protein